MPNLLTITRDFVPDSGHLAFLQGPPLSDTVRVDAGFIAGDEVSAHYDPMIAKLIVHGPTRAIAIEKLRTSLEQYQIAGLTTNVDFLQRVCSNQSFKTGDLETGFITKHKDELFAATITAPEVYAQAAIGSFLANAAALQNQKGWSAFNQPGFGSIAQSRSFNFVSNNPNGTPSVAEIIATVKQLKTGFFDVTVNGSTYSSVASEWDSRSRMLTTFYPHTRLETRVVEDGGNLTLFQQGQQYALRCATPKWVEKALGIKDTAHSVLAPMPCKILRVEAKTGDRVKKDQILVVIESMKMETAIRSPQGGIISRVVHQKGVRNSCLPTSYQTDKF